MNVFVTRASGYVGTPLCHELQFHGHTVLALARSDASAQKLSDAGYTVHRGSLDDLASLQACARAADGVIHTAFNHDFSRYKESGEDDLRVVQAIGEALAGTNKPFVITSGTTVVTAHTRGLESDPGDPESASFPCVASENAIKALASKGVRGSIVRLPPSVHGKGDKAFIPALIGIAKTQRVFSLPRGDTRLASRTCPRRMCPLYTRARESSGWIVSPCGRRGGYRVQGYCGVGR